MVSSPQGPTRVPCQSGGCREGTDMPARQEQQPSVTPKKQLFPFLGGGFLVFFLDFFFRFSFKAEETRSVLSRPQESQGNVSDSKPAATGDGGDMGTLSRGWGGTLRSSPSSGGSRQDGCWVGTCSCPFVPPQPPPPSLRRDAVPVHGSSVCCALLWAVPSAPRAGSYGSPIVLPDIPKAQS